MNSPHARRSAVLRTGLALLATMCVIFSPGCVAQAVPVGRGELVGQYAGGTLAFDLPSGPNAVPVLTAAAAAERALTARGYTIVGRTTSEHESRVEGRYPQPTALTNAVVLAFTDVRGTRVSIRIGGFGDLPESQAIANDMLALIGR
ncbi:MAG: DUF3568 family protein [Phycisphaerales bacterium]|jgi:hypothetical protein